MTLTCEAGVDHHPTRTQMCVQENAVRYTAQINRKDGYFY